MPFVFFVACGVIAALMFRDPAAVFSGIMPRTESWGGILFLPIVWGAFIFPVLGIGYFFVRGLSTPIEKQVSAAVQIPVAVVVIVVGIFFGQRPTKNEAELIAKQEGVLEEERQKSSKEALAEIALENGGFSGVEKNPHEENARYIKSCNFSASGDLIELGTSDESAYFYEVASGTLLDLHRVSRDFEAASVLPAQYRMQYDETARVVTMGEQSPVTLRLNSPALHYVGMANEPGTVILFDDEVRAVQKVKVTSGQVLWSEPLDAAFQDKPAKTWSTNRAWNLIRTKDANDRIGYFLLVNDLAAMGLSELSRQAGFSSDHRLFKLKNTLYLQSKPGPKAVGGTVNLPGFANDEIKRLIQRGRGADLYFEALDGHRVRKTFKLDMASGTDQVPGLGGWQKVPIEAKRTETNFSGWGFGPMSKPKFEGLWQSMAFPELAAFFDGTTLFSKPGENAVFAYRPGEGYAAVGAMFGQRSLATDRRCVGRSPDARKIAMAVGPYLQVFSMDQGGQAGIRTSLFEVPINGKRALELMTPPKTQAVDTAETVQYDPPVFVDTNTLSGAVESVELPGGPIVETEQGTGE
jgi:hypothetical protein